MISIFKDGAWIYRANGTNEEINGFHNNFTGETSSPALN